MLELLSIKKDNKFLDIRYANIVALFFIFLLYFLIILIVTLIFIYFFIPEWKEYPLNILTILFPGGVILAFIFTHAGLKKKSLKLYRDENFIYLDCSISKKESGVQKIELGSKTKIICIKNPFSFYLYYNLFFQEGDRLYMIAPMTRNLPKNSAPILGTEGSLVEKYFGYTKNNIKEISDFLNIPIEIKNSVLGWRLYLYKFYKESDGT